MPRLRGRGGNIGRRTWDSQRNYNRRLNRTAEERLADNVKLRHRAAIARANESPEHRNERLRADALRQRERRRRATDEHRAHDRERVQRRRALTHTSLHCLAFEYEPKIDYSSNSLIVFGNMDKECQHCHPFKYKGE